MDSIGVRELRQHASRWLARVAAGESFTITDRGRPVACLTPIAGSVWERLTATGAVLRAENSLRTAALVAHDSERSLSDLLYVDRDNSA